MPLIPLPFVHELIDLLFQRIALVSHAAILFLSVTLVTDKIIIQDAAGIARGKFEVAFYTLISFSFLYWLLIFIILCAIINLQAN